MAISADLGDVLEKVVTDLVENGRYNSKSEVRVIFTTKARQDLRDIGDFIAADNVGRAQFCD